tara:strand:+ start:3062 stop:3253 length:192 start_codon:yes stop_codon:yes gene_type:complete
VPELVATEHRKSADTGLVRDTAIQDGRTPAVIHHGRHVSILQQQAVCMVAGQEESTTVADTVA